MPNEITNITDFVYGSVNTDFAEQWLNMLTDRYHISGELAQLQNNYLLQEVYTYSVKDKNVLSSFHLIFNHKQKKAYTLHTAKNATSYIYKWGDKYVLRQIEWKLPIAKTECKVYDEASWWNLSDGERNTYLSNRKPDCTSNATQSIPPVAAQPKINNTVNVAKETPIVKKQIVKQKAPCKTKTKYKVGDLYCGMKIIEVSPDYLRLKTDDGRILRKNLNSNDK